MTATLDHAGVLPWREQLGDAFAGLLPEPLCPGPMAGRLTGASLGSLGAYRVGGSPQVVRRTRSAVRDRPTDVLKVCLQVTGRAILHQGGRELLAHPGQLVVYDTRKPYDLRLEGTWECAVMVFPPDALSVPQRWLPDMMDRVHDATHGPGAVLTSFVQAAVADESTSDAAALRFGDAGLQLLCSTLTHAPVPDHADDGADALRLSVHDHVRRHLHDPDLCHASVAAAHRISPRSLDRLFADEAATVTALVRDLRLDGARRELADPRSAHRSVAAIAARWCFADPAHFSRLFKARFGQTASATRP